MTARTPVSAVYRWGADGLHVVKAVFDPLGIMNPRQVPLTLSPGDGSVELDQSALSLAGLSTPAAEPLGSAQSQGP